MAIHRFQTADGKIHRVEAPTRAAAEAELNRVLADRDLRPMGGIPVLGDLGSALTEAKDAIVSEYQRQVSTAKPGAKRSMLDDLASAPRMAGALMGIPGAAVEMFTRPTARAAAAVIPGTNAADNNRIINTALMALRPSPARLAPFADIRPPPRVPGVPATEAKAAQYVQRVANSGGGVSALEAAPADLTAAEALGRSGKTAVGALARREGGTGDALDAVVAERQLSRPQRVLDEFTGATGVSPEAAAGDMAAVVKRGRADAAPLYDEAYAFGGVESPTLTALTNRPSIGRALNRASRIAAEEGRDPTELGFRVVQRAGERKMVPLKRTERVPGGGTREVTDMVPGPQTLEDHLIELQNPTAQTWDYVKRGLDDVLETYRDKTTGKLHLDEEGRAVLETLNTLRNELTTANPAYGKALSTSGDYLSARDAFGKGEKFLFDGNVTERQFAEHLGSLGGGQLDAFRGGIANRLFNLAQNGKLDPKLFKAPRVQAKLRMALGDEPAQRLLGMIAHEGEKLGFERRYAPGANSITSDMRAAMGEQDEMGAVHQAMDDFLSNLHRGPVQALTSAATRGLQNTVAGLRTPGMSVPVRDEAGRLLTMSPQELANYLKSLPPPKPLLDDRGRAIVGKIGTLSQHAPEPTITAWVEGHPEFGVAASYRRALGASAVYAPRDNRRKR